MSLQMRVWFACDEPGCDTQAMAATEADISWGGGAPECFWFDDSVHLPQHWTEDETGRIFCFHHRRATERAAA